MNNITRLTPALRMSRAAPKGPNWHHDHMEKARFMVRFCHEHGLPCAEIVFHLEDSKIKAGGPALRLAEAVWNLHARLRFPESKPLQIAERQSAGHLLAVHDKPEDRRYHVWQGIPEFKQLRMQHLPGAESEPYLPGQQLPLDKTDWSMVKSFFRLQKSWKETGKPYLLQLTSQALSINPANPQVREALTLFTRMVWALEKWRSEGCPESAPSRERYDEANRLWFHFFKSHLWLAEKMGFGTLEGILNATFTPPSR